jgi:hypothetical protein
VTTPRLRPWLLALCAVSSFALAAPARADEAARQRMAELMRKRGVQPDADAQPVPAPPLEPPAEGEPPPAAPPAGQPAAAEQLPQRPRTAPAAATPARATRRRPPAYEPPLGVSLTLSLAGGGAAGTGSRYANSRIVEVEATAGYALLDGLLRPELGVLVATYPHGYVGLRPGLRAFLPDTPLFGRAAVDLADPSGVLRFRWILLGAGAELRLNDLLGVFGELDAGAPLRHQMGFPVLARGGLTARF